jgi:hypothetical protein
MIDERLDILVWAAVLLVLLLMGARAWVVETAESRHYRTSARVRVLTGATGVAIAALVGLMAMQGGITLVQAIATATEPEDFVTIVRPDGTVDLPGDDTPDDPPADPNAPPADPNAPPADPNAPPADPNAPAAPPADPGAPGNGPGAPAGGAPAGRQPAPAAPGG